MRPLVSAVALAGVIVSTSACATVRGPREIDLDAFSGAASLSSWSRVSELAPAAEIEVTTARGTLTGRHFVLADEVRLIVLNLTDSSLPTTVTRVLRRLAREQPGSFAAMQGTGAFAEGNVRVGREGLFLDDRKIAELGQVVESIPRADVMEIQGPVVARGSVAGAALGGFLGFAVGVVPGLGGASPAVTWLALIGSTAGGAALGSRWSGHETGGLVYRTP